MEREIWTAEIVYSGLGLPQRGGAVVLQRAGGRQQIVAIGDLKIARRNFPEAPVRQLGFALSPPPVDAYCDWRQHQAPVAALRHAVGAVVGAAALPALLAAEAQGVAYWAPEALDVAQMAAQLRALPQGSGGMRLGMYLPAATPALLAGAVALARRARLPLLLELPDGALLGELADVGVLAAQPTLLPTAVLDEAAVRLAQHWGCALVCCPYAELEFPWRLCAKHGATVAIGSGQGGPLADTLAAARQRYGEVAGDIALVWSAVKGGYRALRLPPPKLTRGADAAQLFVWR